MTPDLPTVRIPFPSEEDDLIRICKLLHSENGLFDFDEDKVRDVIRRCFMRSGSIVGVIGDPGKIEASTCLLISDMYYCRSWHLAELWNFVLPEYRKSTDIDALIEFGKRCSDQIGIPLITGIITNHRLAPKARLYRRHLGYPAGAFFVYNAHWINGDRPIENDYLYAVETRAQTRRRERLTKMNGTAHVR